jgi:predicted metal-dependent enzyme (double-stranded beta helix superfamily)
MHWTHSGFGFKLNAKEGQTMSFDVEQLVTDARKALGESVPQAAIQEVLERAVREPAAVARALPADHAEIVPLYVSEQLSVIKVVWAPGMSFRPHNHLMWAVIGLYGGQEDNTFYKRSPDGLERFEGRGLHAGDVSVLGANAIHSVRNPRNTFTAAIHIYGGDITRRPGRSEWEEPALLEIPYDFERTRRYFDLASRAPT